MIELPIHTNCKSEGFSAVNSKTLEEIKAQNFESCECDECQTACIKKPGWFLPGEVEVLAENMGATVEQLFENYLMIDYWTGDPEVEREGWPMVEGEGRVYMLSPAVTSRPPGSIFPFNPQGRCVFLTDDLKCSIHDKGKPFECRSFHGNLENDMDHREVAVKWKGHQDKLRKRGWIPKTL